MILRRFMQHIKEQNWFAVWLDILVVVIGIFLGLQFTDWNEQRKINNQIGTYYQRLVEDLESDIAHFQNSKDYYLVVRSYAHRALTDLSSETARLTSAHIVNVYQATQNFYPSLNMFTFDEMKGNGMITELKDIHFRRMLSQYYVIYETLRSFMQPDSEYRINIRKRLSSGTQNLLKKQCGDQFQFLENNTLVVFLAENCPLEFSTEVLAKELMALNNYPSLEQDLNYRISLIDVMVTDLNNVIMQARNIIQYVKSSHNGN